MLLTACQHLPVIHRRQELTPPGLHGSTTGAHPCLYIPYYNRATVLTCTAFDVALVSWYVLEVLRRCDTLQRVADGIIAACVGLVSAAAERYKLREKRL